MIDKISNFVEGIRLDNNRKFTVRRLSIEFDHDKSTASVTGSKVKDS